MPADPSSKPGSKSKHRRIASYQDEDTDLAETPAIPRTTKKKGKHGTSKQKSGETPYDEAEVPEIIDKQPSPPCRPQSVVEEVPFAFSDTKELSDNGDLEDFETTVKLSERYGSGTEAWAQDVPFGKSPPAPSLIEEDARPSPTVQPSYLGRGGFSSKTPPRSPSQKQARPASYGSPIPPVSIPQPSSEYVHRRSASNYGSPPLPHLPQPHFYGAHDVDLGMAYGLGPSLTNEKTFVAFRSIPSSIAHSSTKPGPGIMLGSEDRLDVLAMDATHRYHPIGALCGLHGTVHDATFLTWESGHDPFAQLRPLVALIINGPRINSQQVDGDDMSLFSGAGPNRTSKIHGYADYETRVEVWSMTIRTCLATLMTLSATGNPLIRRAVVPQPAGGLRLAAAGRSLIVSSGASGELWLFAPGPGPQLYFECRGKLWTNVQIKEQNRDSSHSRSPEAIAIDQSQITHELEIPIYSVSGRWLAISPPGISSRSSIGAQIACHNVSKSLARVDALSAPTRPSTSCAVDSPDAETLLGKVARGVAQEVVRGARWLGDQGMQTWNNYWKKEQPEASSPTNTVQLYPPQLVQQGAFPPTHGQDHSRASREPEVVSIINLEDVELIATFQPPGGCSFLSFTPSGLGLLSASRKGDVQYVWDLMQAKYLRSAAFLSDGGGAELMTPRVRQIAKFERLTPSSIVDVIWEPCVGERFALLTKRGTVHLFDMPESAFRWPPPRRSKGARPMSAPSQASVSEPNESAPAGGFLANAISIASKTQPMLANLRGRAPSFAEIGSTGLGLASATGVAGGRAVAAGLSKSLGAATGTVNSLRHAGENRLRLEFLAKEPLPGRISWNRQNQRTVITCLKMDSIRNYYVKRSQLHEHRPAQRVSQFEATKAISVKLPNLDFLRNNVAAESTRNLREGQGTEIESIQGFWHSHASQGRPSTRISHPLSHAEIETNAPYQPFHSDPRVSLFVYTENLTGDLDESLLPTASTTFTLAARKQDAAPSQQWVFGEPMPALKLNIHASYDQENDQDRQDVYRETIAMSVLKGEVPEQIVSTTRRKKLKKGDESQLEQEGFFEDDCDVLDFATDRV